MIADYLVVGSGLTGATIARLLADSGKEVIVVERRPHLGGNVFDEVHPSGIRIHTYGPHYFRTDSDTVWQYVNRFSVFYRYEASLQSYVDGKYENWPILGSYITRTVGNNWQPDFHGIPSNFEEASLSMMPRLVYEKFVKGYTEKQWGVDAHTLSANLAKRFDVRNDEDKRLVRCKYQGIPSVGYAKFMSNMLEGIPVLLNCDYLKNRGLFEARKHVIYTGPIDEYFNYELGKLRYRGQIRSSLYYPDMKNYQPCGQVNNPDKANGPHIRTLEWKYMMPDEYASRVQGTVITTEVPYDPDQSDHYEYPFPDEYNRNLFEKYSQKSMALSGLTICGRLGHYQYYDMDKAIEKSMAIYRSLC